MTVDPSFTLFLFWPTAYRGRGANALVVFTYQRPLNDTCLTHLAQTHKVEDIVVEFVPLYSAEAHEHMALKGFAPRLCIAAR